MLEELRIAGIGGRSGFLYGGVVRLLDHVSHEGEGSILGGLRSITDLTPMRPGRKVLVGVPQETRIVTDNKSEILQGTLDLMVLKTLEAMGPLHGYGISVRLGQMCAEVFRFNQGTVYASLVRLVQKGWVSAAWGVSDNNRRAKFYSITRSGRRRLSTEADQWHRVSGVVTRLLQLAAVP